MESRHAEVGENSPDEFLGSAVSRETDGQTPSMLANQRAVIVKPSGSEGPQAGVAPGLSTNQRGQLGRIRAVVGALPKEGSEGRREEGLEADRKNAAGR